MRKEKKKLQIVLDMDLTMIFATIQKPESKEAKDTDVNYVVVKVSIYKLIRIFQNEEFGKDIYVYKRPNLNEFLTKLQKIGTVSVFVAHPAKYADPILDKLDPQNKFF